MSNFTTTIDETVAPPPADQPSSSADGGPGRHLGLALTLICAAQLMVVLDGTIVNIALPHIETDLGFTKDNLSWVVNAYTLTFGGLLLLGGRMGDLLGRRNVFISGVLLFALASLLGGIAQSETILLASRALQGVGAAMASPTALSLITTTFPAGKARNRAFGVYAAMSGAGAAIGLILGGVLTEFSWRWTFFINVPIGIAVAIMAPRILAESARQTGKFDFPGALTGSLGLGSLVYGLTHAAQPGAGWGDKVTLVTLIGGAVLLLAFIAIEYFSKHPLLPFRVLTDRTRGVSFVVMLVVGASLFSMFYFLGLFIQQVLGYSPVKTGFAFLPFSFGIIAAAQLSSYLVGRIDPRWISGPGAILAAIGMYGFSHLTIASSYATNLLPWIAVLAFGMGLTFVPMTLTAVVGVAERDSGVGSAVLNTMQQIGGAIGLAALSTVFANNLNDKAHELGATLQQQIQSGQLDPAKSKKAMAQIAAQAQTFGSTQAFLVASVMILGAAAIILIGLNIRHQRLATDGAEPVAHIG